MSALPILESFTNYGDDKGSIITVSKENIMEFIDNTDASIKEENLLVLMRRLTDLFLLFFGETADKAEVALARLVSFFKEDFYLILYVNANTIFETQSSEWTTTPKTEVVRLAPHHIQKNFLEMVGRIIGFSFVIIPRKEDMPELLCTDLVVDPSYQNDDNNLIFKIMTQIMELIGKLPQGTRVGSSISIRSIFAISELGIMCANGFVYDSVYENEFAIVQFDYNPDAGTTTAAELLTFLRNQSIFDSRENRELVINLCSQLRVDFPLQIKPQQAVPVAVAPPPTAEDIEVSMYTGLPIDSWPARLVHRFRTQGKKHKRKSKSKFAPTKSRAM